MTIALEEVRGTRPVAEVFAPRALGVLALGLAGWALATTVSNGAASLRLVVSALVVLWAATGLLLAVRRPSETVLAMVVSGAAALAAAGVRVDVVRPFGEAVVPWVAMYVVLAMP
ncbi:MAG TPA: hypothetical protein VEN82_07805, partial [Actinomycetota bacterium]|nr:hypothetical protein [Actinomycetota bacterium]